jgi:hypothetical protein
LARTLAARDIATFEHARRVRRYARALATSIGIEDEESLRTIETAALFHDVGKLAIPGRLLAKAGPLTPEEYEQVKRHAAIGAAAATAMMTDRCGSMFDPNMIEVFLSIADGLQPFSLIPPGAMLGAGAHVPLPAGTGAR